MRLAFACDSVIFSRVSPKQKQQIYIFFINSLEYKFPEKTCLAIGDGANDVNMIIAAHIGVGIIGREGQQAARASDYAIGEFQLLMRLQLFHGRESYRKNSVLILYNFQKNLLLVLPQFWLFIINIVNCQRFGFMTGFSGTFLYDTWIFQLFNLIFTSMPIVFYALFDKEQKFKEIKKNSYLYKSGIQTQFKDQYFTNFLFWQWFWLGAIYAGLLLLLCFGSFHLVSSDVERGTTSDLHVLGMLLFGLIIIIINCKIFNFSCDISLSLIIIIFLSIASYFLILLILSQIPSYKMYGIFDQFTFYLKILQEKQLNDTTFILFYHHYQYSHNYLL